MAQTVKNLPAMQEMWILSLDQEDPLEKGMTSQSHCMENSMNRGAWWAAESDMIEHARTHAYLLDSE